QLALGRNSSSTWNIIFKEWSPHILVAGECDPDMTEAQLDQHQCDAVSPAFTILIIIIGILFYLGTSNQFNFWPFRKQNSVAGEGSIQTV
ncbi:MAG: hypothetical protein K5Q00_02680, partial [Gammaproteobacteria bacterium]|nr:hypothetical protein [Gammaproteobacteria bacterium]